MKVLVTGASGFVGSYVCEQLQKEGHVPVAFIRQRTGGDRPPLWEMLGACPQIVEGDLRDQNSIMNALKETEPDAVIHLGAKAYVPYSYKNPTDVFETNIRGTFNVLEAIRLTDNNIRFVFAGSSEEYGKVGCNDIPLSAGSPLQPVSPYAYSKVVSERQALLYHSLYGTPAIISRAFNHEGPGRGDMYVTSAICKQVVGGDSISLGNVNSFRDWSHVRDIARGYIALAEKGVPGRVYVQGSGKMHSVLSFALLALRYYRGDEIASIESMDEVEFLESPLDKDCDLSSQWAQNALDDTMIRRIEMGEEMFPLERTGVVVAFENSPFMRIFFDVCKWRPVDVPLLLASPNIHEVGVEQAYGLNHIIAEMIDYYEENTPRRSGH